MLKEGFLPAYGFPTHVVSFETLNLSVLSKYQRRYRNLIRATSHLTQVQD